MIKKKIFSSTIAFLFSIVFVYGITLCTPKVYAESGLTFDEFTDAYMEMMQGETYEQEIVKFKEDEILTQYGQEFVLVDDFTTKANVETEESIECVSIVKNEYKSSLTQSENNFETKTIFLNGKEYVNLSMVCDELGYNIKVVSDGIELTREFQSKRLIVEYSGTLDNYGAIYAVEGYKNYHFYSYETESQAKDAYEKLSAIDGVVVSADGYVSCESFASTGEEDEFVSWGGEAIDADDFCTYLLNTYGEQELNSREMVVAVLDTGIKSSHSWFSGRIASGGKNFTAVTSTTDTENVTSKYEDGHGHGTHCSGIITDLTFDNVKILPIKILTDSGSGSDSSVLMGMEYVNSLAENGTNIVAANMSFGGPSAIGSAYYNLSRNIITDMVSNGISVCVSAGNDSTDAVQSCPSNIAEAITVASTAYQGSSYFISGFSNYGNLVDVSAPGSNILSAGIASDTATKVMSGTSMACPCVVGAVALIKTMYPTFTTTQVENLLKGTALDLGEYGFDEIFGYGMINLKYAQYNYLQQLEFSDYTYSHDASFELTITSQDAGVEIHYTLDGTDPTTSSPQYTTLITISQTSTVKARAFTIVGGEITAVSKATTCLYAINETTSESDFTFSDGVITGYTGTPLNVTIPSQIGGVTVTEIGTSAFAGKSIISITLPNTVTKIGDSAFQDCTYLQTIVANGVTSIGAYGFCDCVALEYVDDDHFENVQTIGNYGFMCCQNLNDITLSKLTTLGDRVFYQCGGTHSNLKVIDLPNATQIGKHAFTAISTLQTVNIPKVTAISDYTFYQDSALTTVNAPKIETIGLGAFAYCTSLKTLNYNSVTAIGTSAFYGCESLQRVDFDNAKTIGSGAFFECNDLAIANFDSAYNIGSDAFYSCNSLFTLNIPNAFTIGSGAFALCSALKEVNIPNINTIDDNAFNSCIALEKVTLSNNVQYIDYGAFLGCVKLTDINLDGVQELRSYVSGDDVSSVFACCTSLQTVSLNSLITIPEFTFLYCTSLESVNAPNAIEIGTGAFASCSALCTVTAPNVEIIGDYAFMSCTSLTSLSLPKVKTLGSTSGYVFYDTGITTLQLPNIQIIGKNTFIQSSIEKLYLGKSLKYVNGANAIPKSIAIYGYSGSFAEQYATSNDNEFVAVDVTIVFDVEEPVSIKVGESVDLTLTSSGDIVSWGLCISTEQKYKIEDVDDNTVRIYGYEDGTIIVQASATDWSGDEVYTNELTITVIGISTITSASSDNGSISPNGTSNYDYGTNPKYTFTANTGYHVEQIIVDNTNLTGVDFTSAIENGYTFSNVKANHSIRVVFAENTNTAYTVNHYKQTLSETQIQVGDKYYVLESTENLTGTTNAQTLAVAQNYEGFTAQSFEQKTILPNGSQVVNIYYNINYYTISVNANSNGTITPNTTQTLAYLSNQTYNFTPNTGYHVEQIIVDNTNLTGTEFTNAVENGYTFSNVNANHSIRVVFAENTNTAYTVNHYKQTLSETQIQVDDKYYVLESTENLTGTTNAQTVAVAQNYEGFTAQSFEQKTILADGSQVVNIYYNINYYTIFASAGENGTISFAGEKVVKYGDTITYTFTPNTGYQIASILVDGEEIAIVNNYTFTDVSQFHSIGVSFEKQEIETVINVSGQGTIVAAESSTLYYGQNKVYVVNAKEGWHIDKVYVNGVEQQLNGTTFTLNNVTETPNIQVVFEEDKVNYELYVILGFGVLFVGTIIVLCVALAKKKKYD